MFSAEVESTRPESLKSIILGLGKYFLPVNVLPKQKHAMLHGMSKPRGLKVGCYAACLVEINEYLAIFHWAKISDRICVTELND